MPAPQHSPDLTDLLWRVTALESRTPAAPADEAADTLVLPRRRAPAWLGWVAAAVGAGYAGYVQVGPPRAAAVDNATAAAVERLESRLERTEARQAATQTELVRIGVQVDRIAGDVAVLAARGR